MTQYVNLSFLISYHDCHQPHITNLKIKNTLIENIIKFNTYKIKRNTHKHTQRLSTNFSKQQNLQNIVSYFKKNHLEQSHASSAI